MPSEDDGTGLPTACEGDKSIQYTGTPWMLEKAVFPAREENVGAARRWLRKVLDGHPRCDDAVLLLSEAMTNSIVHTRSAVIATVVIIEEDGRVQIEIIDDGAETMPSMCRYSPGDLVESGRGIRLIRALSNRWGFGEERPRCVVWFVLDP